MYAIVAISGTQVKVEEGIKVWVPYMAETAPGENLTFEDVLVVKKDNDIRIGQPVVEGAVVKATLLEHRRGPKLIVFRKRRRKSFRRKKGHRQNYSILRIEEIVV